MPGKLDVRRVFPTEVGWETDLYRSPEPDEARAQWLEHEIFQRVDNDAAKVLSKLNGPDPLNLSDTERVQWVLFVRSLAHRTPHGLAATMKLSLRIEELLMERIGSIYDQIRGPEDPTTFGEYAASITDDDRRRMGLRRIPDSLVNPTLGEYILNVRWRIFHLGSDCPRLLLSDDPIARTNGMKVLNGHMGMPLGPRRYLLMAEEKATIDLVTSQRPKETAANINRWIVESARRFVVAADRSQDRFVSNRFGRDPKAAMGENLAGLDEIVRDEAWPTPPLGR